MNKKVEFWINLVILLSIEILLIYSFDFSVILKAGMSTGGDSVYHFDKLNTLINDIFPRFKLGGWTDGKGAGYPLLMFYPPFIFYLGGLLNLILAEGTAYALMIPLGILMTPIAVFFSMKMIKKTFPSPIMASILVCFTIFHTDHFAFGGNLKSILSGEIAHMISIPFLILFIGLFFRSLKEKNNKKYSFWATILLFLASITQPISGFVGFLFFFWIFFKGKIKDDLLHSIKIFLPAGLMFLYWGASFIYFKKFSPSSILSNSGWYYGWPINTLSIVFPDFVLPFVIMILLLMLLFSFKIKHLKSHSSLFIFGIIISLAVFSFSLLGGWGIRFLPFSYIFIVMFLAGFLGQILSKKTEKNILFSILFILFSIIGLFVVITDAGLIKNNRSVSRGVFLGIERYADKKHMDMGKLNTYLKETVGDSRIFSTWNGHGKGEWIRTKTDLNVFTGMFGYSYNNIYIGSLKTALNRKGTDMHKIAQQFNLYNISTIIDYNKDAIFSKNFNDSKDFSLIKDFGTIKVYKNLLAKEKYASVLKYQPYGVKNYNDWAKLAMKSFEKINLDKPLIVESTDDKFIKIDNFNDIKSKEKIDTNCQIYSEYKRDTISINTDCIGKPVIVKVSYFPHWKVKGADKIYRISPSLMLIYPKQKNIKMYYGKHWIDYFEIISFFSGLTLLFYFRFNKNEFSFGEIVFIKKIKKGKFLIKTYKIITNKKLLNYTLVLLFYITMYSSFNTYYKMNEKIKTFFVGDSKNIINQDNLDDFYNKGVFSLINGDIKEGKKNAYKYINRGTDKEKKGELIYHIMQSYKKELDFDKYIHEIKSINLIATNSTWAKRANIEYMYWLKTLDKKTFEKYDKNNGLYNLPGVNMDELKNSLK